MAAMTPAKPAFAGLNIADDLKAFEPDLAGAAARPDPVAMAEVSARAGFPSREPQAAKRPASLRPLNFDTRLTVRVAARDKQRFEDLAYSLRCSNGEALRRLLDHFAAGDAPAE